MAMTGAVPLSLTEWAASGVHLFPRSSCDPFLPGRFGAVDENQDKLRGQGQSSDRFEGLLHHRVHAPVTRSKT